MNSNFWFNYEKKQEEMKSKPLVEKLEDNMEDGSISYKNDNKKDDQNNKKLKGEDSKLIEASPFFLYS